MARVVGIQALMRPLPSADDVPDAPASSMLRQMSTMICRVPKRAQPRDGIFQSSRCSRRTMGEEIALAISVALSALFSAFSPFTRYPPISLICMVQTQDVGPDRGSQGSQLTRWWREVDSNRRSPV